MPNYDYVCENCGDYFEQFNTLADYKTPTETPCKECGETTVEIMPQATSIVSGVNVRKKIPDTFKDVLRDIKSKHRHSTIDV